MNEILKPNPNAQPFKKGGEKAGFLETKERLTKTLGDLIHFQTIADGEHQDQIRGLFDYVESSVVIVEQQSGRKFIRKEWNNEGHLSAIITPFDPAQSKDEVLLHPKMAMLIHADVVGAENGSLFTLKQDGDSLLGRGVQDMKGALTIGLDLLSEMPVGFSLIITSDEEIGGEHGAQYLAEHVGLNPEFLIVLDGQKPEQLSLGAKGIWQTKVIFNSLLNKGGHGSRREDYSANALGRDMDNELETIYPWELDQSPQGITYNVGEIHGGVATNKIAQHSEYKVDMRFPTEKEKTEGKENLHNVLETIVVKRLHQIYGEQLPVDVKTELRIDEGKEVFVVNIEDPKLGTTYSVISAETLADLPVYTIDPQNILVQRFAKIVEKITGKDMEYNPQDTGGNDGTNFPETPAVLYVAKGGGIHTSEEWASATSLVQTREAIAQLMHETLG